MLPGLRDHHQDGFFERVAAEGQQFEGLIKASGIAGPRRANRKCPRQIWKMRAVEKRLAGTHPVAVALDRVDFAVVGNESIRMR